MEQRNGRESIRKYIWKSKQVNCIIYCSSSKQYKNLKSLLEMLLEPVWIQLKTEKYCSKIIFKSVKCTVWPFFLFLNKVVVSFKNRTWIMHEQYNRLWTVTSAKKKWKKDACWNAHLVHCWNVKIYSIEYSIPQPWLLKGHASLLSL